MSTDTPKSHIFLNVLAIALTLIGFVIMLPFTGVVYVTPGFEGQAEALKGAAVLCMMVALRLMLFTYPPIEQHNSNVKMLKRLSYAGMLLSLYIIAAGLYQMHSA